MGGERTRERKPVSIYRAPSGGEWKRDQGGSAGTGGNAARREGVGGGRQSHPPAHSGRHAEALGNDAGYGGERRAGSCAIVGSSRSGSAVSADPDGYAHAEDGRLCAGRAN